MHEPDEDDIREYSDEQLWVGAVDESAFTRYESLHELAIRSIDAKELDQALSITLAALDAARASEDPELLADAWSTHSGVLWDLERYAEAAAALQDALPFYDEADMPGAAALTQLRLSMCFAEGHMIDAIMPSARQAIARFSAEQYYGLVPHAVLELADRVGQLGQTDDALELIRASREYCIKHDVAHGLDHAKLHEVQVLHESGQSEMALELVLGWREEELAGEPSEFVQRASLGAAVIMNDTEQYERSHAFLLDVFEHHMGGVEPALLADLICLDAHALHGLEQTEAALSRIGEARAIVTHWGEAMSGAELRIGNYDFSRATWLLGLDRPSDAEPIWRSLLRTGVPEVQGMLSDYLGYTLLELERSAEALALLEPIDVSQAFVAMPDSVYPVWHASLLAQALSELGDWSRAAAVAADALESAIRVPGNDGYIAELWVTRALEIIDRDAEAACAMFGHAFDAYELAEDTSGQDDARDFMNCTIALIASQWDMTAVTSNAS